MPRTVLVKLALCFKYTLSTKYFRNMLETSLSVLYAMTYLSELHMCVCVHACMCMCLSQCPSLCVHVCACVYGTTGTFQSSQQNYKL